MTLQPEGVTSGICHCASCQKQSGSAYSAFLIAPAGSVTVEGPLAEFRDANIEGAAVVRAFCPACGSPVETSSDAISAMGVRVIKAGLLDGGAPAPQVQLFCENEVGWAAAVPESARFQRMPEAPPG